jgi:ABC-type dipeptide/oligopeptide/nickel transport system permease component
VRFAVRRAAAAALLVFLTASFALLLARVAPGDHLAAFEGDPGALARERARLGLDRPLHEQYWRWLGGVLRLDFGESVRYPGRPISTLVAERSGNSILLGAVALVLATLVGVPAGVLAGSRHAPGLKAAMGGASFVVLSLPPVVLGFALLLVASRTGWFPVGGLPAGGGLAELARHLVLPVIALALPAAATLERVQARAIAAALAAPSILAARGRGLPPSRLLWRHALRLSLPPVLSIYGIVCGALLSGSFVVEYVMSWLGRLMYDGLLARDAHLVAACAATGGSFLAAGVFLADLALAAADPRTAEAP